MKKNGRCWFGIRPLYNNGTIFKSDQWTGRGGCGSEQQTWRKAKELKQLADSKGLHFAVTYTYTGYAMVKLAR